MQKTPQYSWLPKGPPWGQKGGWKNADVPCCKIPYEGSKTPSKKPTPKHPPATPAPGLRGVKAGCHSLKAMKGCIKAKDGRRGKFYSDSPCQWCCGKRCPTGPPKLTVCASKEGKACTCDGTVFYGRKYPTGK